MTKFIEKSYLITSIMYINRKYLNKNYVTKSELNSLMWHIQNKLNENDVDALFVHNDCFKYYDDCGDIFVLNNNYSFDNVKQRFQSFLPIDILKILWDEEVLLSLIIDNLDKEYEESVKKLYKYKKQ